MKQYPSAIVGLIIIIIISSMAIYTTIAIPYDEAVIAWRGDEVDTYRNPEKVPPVWTNMFRTNKLPEGFAVMLSDEGEGVKVEDNSKDGIQDVTYYYDFDVTADDYFQEVLLYMTAKYEEKQPFIETYLTTPDGREIRMINGGVDPVSRFYISQDEKLPRRVKWEDSIIGLFSTPESLKAEMPEVLKGKYTLKVRVKGFEPGSTTTTEFITHGKVYGNWGTDHMRRDLKTAIMWGAPIALAFGLIAAFGISIITLTISATGTWYGGWLDQLINRITEVNMMLPFLPILIMVGTFYSKSLWTILGTVILLSIFSSSIKTYRATFLQVKQSTYIEAAQIYGASNRRIIFKYMMPRVIPMLIPNLVLSIPSYVFLEASLAVLGLGDPTLPTWGKIINDAYSKGALWNGQFYWVLEPAVLLMITGFSFALVGFALDKIFNPRLRDQ